MKYLITIISISILITMLSGCADSMSYSEATFAGKVGFWYGLWHGLIFPIAWIVSLFSENTAIYAIYNNGGWYDFGYFLGISGTGFSFVKFNLQLVKLLIIFIKK